MKYASCVSPSSNDIFFAQLQRVESLWCALREVTEKDILQTELHVTISDGGGGMDSSARA